MPAPATDVFRAIADPARREILDVLRDGPRPAGDLVAHLPLAQSTVSGHLKVLADTGLVVTERRGTSRIYSLDAESLASVDTWLAPYRRFWDERLDRLGDVLDHIAAEGEPDEGGRRET